MQVEKMRRTQTEKNKVRSIIAGIICMSLIPAGLCGCSGQKQEEKKDEPAQAIEFVTPVESATAPEEKNPSGSDEPNAEETVTGRQDGERFEETIMLEGMEETVRYEHVRDFVIGFEMDYDYESLARKKESDREMFISVYDDPDNAQNYLEVTYTGEVVDSAVSLIAEELSKEYETVTEQDALDKAGSCTRLTTTEAKSTAKSPDLLQTVYILPAGDGSIVAKAHYTIESAEGFGHRFDHMMNTLTVIGRTAESKLSNEQALSAIKNYCFANNPDLEAMSGSDDYSIYWDVSNNDAGETVVLYRSYTGAQISYHIDPDSGETYVTEFVPGITDEEQRTDETFNVRAYM